MSNYEKQNFEPGQILTAAQLNYIEDGIGQLSEAKAIREKNGTTERYTPVQFGAAIRALN